MASKLQVRRDTTANWGSVDPILSEGEPGYDTDLEAFKIGNAVDIWSVLPWMNGSATIDDGAVDTSAAWSAQKVQAQIDAMAASNATTPAASVTPTVISANKLTDVTITISNYNATYTYNVTSDDVNVVTVSRTGAIITATLVNVSGNQTANITVNVWHTDYVTDTDTVIGVTNNDVQYSIADSLIQITDFLLDVDTGGITNFSYTNGITATADSAYYRTQVYSQDVGEANWTDHVVTLTAGYAQLNLEWKAGDGYWYFTPDDVTTTAVIGVDIVGNEEEVAASITSQTGLITLWNATMDTIVLDLGVAINGGHDMSNDEEYIYHTTGSIIRVFKRRTPFTGLNYDFEYDWTPTATGVYAISTLADCWMSPDGLIFIILTYHAATNASNHFMVVYDLPVAYDVRNATVKSYHDRAIVSNNQPSLAEYRHGISFSKNGTRMYYAGGYAQALGQGYLYYYDTVTPWDFNNQTYTGSAYQSASYCVIAVDVSWDDEGGTYIQQADDNAGYYSSFICPQGITNAFDGTLSNYQDAQTTSARGVRITDNGHSYSNSSISTYMRSSDTSLTPIVTIPPYIQVDVGSAAITIVDVYPKPIAPILHFEAELTLPAMDYQTSPLIITPTEPAGLYLPTGGYISRDFTFPTTVINARYVQLEVESDLGAIISGVVVEMTFLSDTPYTPPVVVIGDIDESVFSTVVQNISSFTYRA
jgi:hypothetical protein